MCDQPIEDLESRDRIEAMLHEFAARIIRPGRDPMQMAEDLRIYGILVRERDALRSLVLRVLLAEIDDRWVVEAMGLLGLTVESLAERAGGQ